MRRSLPRKTSRPSTRAWMPRPGRASNSSTLRKDRPFSSASCTTAVPRGCSLAFSTEAATASNSSSPTPSAYTSVTTGRPSVRVPVLSKTMVWILPMRSRLSPPLMRMPSSAPLPVPTMMAVGVARPRAQGQAMTSTATKLSRARLNTGSTPASIQTTKVSRAMPMTVGTKTAATLSARRWMGALEPWASSTMRMIWARTVSRPTRSARKRKVPVPLMVAPTTSSPGFFSTGMGSPVSMDSSTALAPSVTTPSTGIFSPGRTTMMSRTMTSSMGMSLSSPSRTTRAVLACRPISRRMASEVLPLARASR